MQRIAVLLTLHLENIRSDFDTLRKREQQFIKDWQAAGHLEHFFLNTDRTGAILLFKLEVGEVEKLMKSLPFYPYMSNVSYVKVDKNF